MSTVQLGSAFRSDLGMNLDAQSFVDAIAAAVLEQVQARMPKQPVVNVAPAQVSVQPAVTVTPDVNVTVPEMEPAEVTIPGMTDVAKYLAKVDGHLVELIALLSKPEVKNVQRDGNGLITRVTETRA